MQFKCNGSFWDFSWSVSKDTAMSSATVAETTKKVWHDMVPDETNKSRGKTYCTINLWSTCVSLLCVWSGLWQNLPCCFLSAGKRPPSGHLPSPCTHQIQWQAPMWWGLKNLTLTMFNLIKYMSLYVCTVNIHILYKYVYITWYIQYSFRFSELNTRVAPWSPSRPWSRRRCASRPDLQSLHRLVLHNQKRMEWHEMIWNTNIYPHTTM